MTPEEFIDRWKPSGGGEIANSQMFLAELCTLLGVPVPDPTVTAESENTYVVEKAVKFNNGDGTTSDGRVDLYRAGCFVLESKQGSEKRSAEVANLLSNTSRNQRIRKGAAQRGTAAWDTVMVKARQQAKRYAEAVDGEWPPFLIVVDVGFCFDLYADFTQSGKNYLPFPDPSTYRIQIERLAEDKVRETLKALWLDPHSLDPAKQSADITREVAVRLGRLAKSLEADHDPHDVAQFLMRLLFTMYAEDVPVGGFALRDFENELKDLRERGAVKDFVPLVENLWATMDGGGYSGILKKHIKQFNGGLFEDHTALPLNDDQLNLLIEAAEMKWTNVEPAIFGTLLERALDPVERHKLGAHYTPRAYVERLVMPTIIEPLRTEWENVYATALAEFEEGESIIEELEPAVIAQDNHPQLKRGRKLKRNAVKQIRDFHDYLCNIIVLDPACGSGNFLYVSMELMKRLEGEVINVLRDFGEAERRTITIDPHQFKGIEVNQRAAVIADLVLWIGYLQWFVRTHDSDPPEPIIKKGEDYKNIECRDAVLAWDSIEEVFDDDGNPVTRWDGRTTKPHPLTGEEVPDETARVQELRYINPSKAEWPKADFVVGNPPFVGIARMREALGDGYTEAIRATYEELPESLDYVMYWWHTAARLIQTDSIRCFGLITTNSIRQTFNRRVIKIHSSSRNPVSIVFAIPDHPWVDAAFGADVRIAMTVVQPGTSEGLLARVVEETKTDGEQRDLMFLEKHGFIFPNLTIGANVGSAAPLKANAEISSRGMMLFGSGFILKPDEIASMGFDIKRLPHVIRPYRNGRDLTQTPRGVFVIDCFGLSESGLRSSFPKVYQWIVERVKPERDQNRDKKIRSDWWLHGRPRPELRQAIKGLSRYIATVETSKHRFFDFIDESVVPDNMLVNIGLDDGHALGVLSSKIHILWSLAAGGRLGVGNDPRYNKTKCFETFAFPASFRSKKIGNIAEQLHSHRKKQQELHPKLTMTGMYNVLEKLRAGEELTDKEKVIHEQGLVSVLKQIHDDLDAAVFDAYGWPLDLTDEEILQRLVDLNHERAEEEKRGMIRWLRPEFQNPDGDIHKQKQQPLGLADEKTAAKGTAKKGSEKTVKIKKVAWPETERERIQLVREKLLQHGESASVADVAKYFSRANKRSLEELLNWLSEMGFVRVTESGEFVA